VHWAYFRSIFRRRPNFLEPLDGIRALATLWVMCAHVWGFWPVCHYCKLEKYTFMNIMLAGDMGVDMFFVLSGFLICSSLLKECSKNEGAVDYFLFIKNRFWRLWPTLFAYEFIQIPFFTLSFRDPKKLWLLKELIFINNFPIGGFQATHIWSVALEF